MADVAVPIPDDLLSDAPPLSDDDLDAYLADELTEGGGAGEPVPDNPVERWTISSLSDAEWAMGRMAEAQGHLAELAEQRAEWTRTAMDKIDRWHQRASRRAARTVQVMAAKLERYALEQRAQDPKVKSIPLPSGTVKTTEAKPKPKVLDDTAVAQHVEWLLDDSQEHTDAAQAWWAALSKADVAPEDLVKRDPKVYAGPFAKIVTVAEVPTGEVAWVLGLSCGHELEVHTEDGTSEPADPRLGESLACQACDTDPIEGRPTRTVTELERIPLTAWRVLGPDGQPVPGAVVEPGSVTAKAVPGA